MKLIDEEKNRDVLTETVRVELTLAELMVIQSMAYRTNGGTLREDLYEDYPLARTIEEPWRVRDALQITASEILEKKGVEST